MKFPNAVSFLALIVGTLGREKTQSGATWGLRAISHREPHARPWQSSLRRFDYTYDDDAAGQGTFAYVVDSGVRISHQELEGRAENLWTADWTKWPDETPDYADKIGHGTHVAGIIASRTYGVAKKARIVSVKVRDRAGRYRASTLLSGINRAVRDIIDKGRVGKAVINISLGVGPGGCLDGAVQDAIRHAVAAKGITVVQGAGNDCQVLCAAASSSNVGGAITVGNIKPDWRAAETSNLGPAVDMFAPGTDILSLSSTDDRSVASKTGTSMAAPHVAGVALGFMSGGDGGGGGPQRRSRDDVWHLLKTTSTKDKIKGNLRAAPNRLVNNNNSKQGK